MSSDDSAAHGRRFRELRKSQGMTQRDIARRAEVDVSTVSRFERGETIEPHTSKQLWTALWKARRSPQG